MEVQILRIPDLSNKKPIGVGDIVVDRLTGKMWTITQEYLSDQNFSRGIARRMVHTKLVIGSHFYNAYNEVYFAPCDIFDRNTPIPNKLADIGDLLYTVGKGEIVSNTRPPSRPIAIVGEMDEDMKLKYTIEDVHIEFGHLEIYPETSFENQIKKIFKEKDIAVTELSELSEINGISNENLEKIKKYFLDQHAGRTILYVDGFGDIKILVMPIRDSSSYDTSLLYTIKDEDILSIDFEKDRLSIKSTIIPVFDIEGVTYRKYRCKTSD